MKSNENLNCNHFKKPGLLEDKKINDSIVNFWMDIPCSSRNIAIIIRVRTKIWLLQLSILIERGIDSRRGR